jgi:hypothetical protein
MTRRLLVPLNRKLNKQSANEISLKLPVESQSTCLILGAGASAHLGFPLGRALRDAIVMELQNPDFSTSGARRLQIPQGVIDRANPDDLRENLGFGNWNSPDAFLEHHPEHLELGKHLIASQLRKHEKPNVLMLEKRGWYNSILEFLTADSAASLESKRLSIITYNYDRSVDHLIHRFFQYRYKMGETEAWRFTTQTAPIIHLHGSLGDYPDIGYGVSTTDTQEAADAIKIISEVQNNAPGFAAAQQVLKNSARIVIVGFGFAKQNVDRLNFFSTDSIQDREVKIICGYSQGPIVDKRLYEWIQQWGLSEKNRLNGDAAYVFAAADPINV